MTFIAVGGTSRTTCARYPRVLMSFALFSFFYLDAAIFLDVDVDTRAHTGTLRSPVDLRRSLGESVPS